jgi:hypothetical protein
MNISGRECPIRTIVINKYNNIKRIAERVFLSHIHAKPALAGSTLPPQRLRELVAEMVD